MENPQQLPPNIYLYLQEQERKKKKNRNTVIIICVVIFILLGIIGNLIDDKQPQKDLSKEKKQVDRPIDQKNSIVDTVSKLENTTKGLSKEEQDFKARDAVAILDVYVKHNMNDPDSFEEISYDYSYHETYFIIVLKYRGKNAFGAKVLNFIKAKTDLEGEVLKVIDTD